MLGLNVCPTRGFTGRVLHARSNRLRSLVHVCSFIYLVSNDVITTPVYSLVFLYLSPISVFHQRYSNPNKITKYFTHLCEAISD